MRTHWALWGLVSNSPRILTSSKVSVSNLQSYSIHHLLPLVTCRANSGIEVSGHSSKLPVYPRLCSFSSLSCQGNPTAKVPPRSLSGQISQDTLEKSCTDLGQVRLCFEWLWCMLIPERPCAIWERRHIQVHSKWLVVCRLFQSLWLNMLTALDFSFVAVTGSNHSVIGVIYSMPCAWNVVGL